MYITPSFSGGVERTEISKLFRAVLTSPFDVIANFLSVLSSILTLKSFSPFSDVKALLRIVKIFSSES